MAGLAADERAGASADQAADARPGFRVRGTTAGRQYHNNANAAKIAKMVHGNVLPIANPPIQAMIPHF